MSQNMIENMAKAARVASRVTSNLRSNVKNKILLEVADTLEAEIQSICAANSIDMAEARKNRMDEALLDRLYLSPERIKAIAADVRHVAGLEDPINKILGGRELNNGVRLTKRCTPLGVVAAIYEARPNVTIDIAVLCLKTGNAVILRGGKETVNSNKVLVDILQRVLYRNNVPAEAVQSIFDPDKELLTALLQQDKYIDMLIPRGGDGLQQFCRATSRIPVITGGIGVCHIFVDESAKQDLALEILVNAKVQRPSVCNAVETVIVHNAIAPEFIPKMAERLGREGVTFHAGTRAFPYFPKPCKCHVVPLNDEELDREWLTLDVNVTIATDFDIALEIIHNHSSGHSDAILTENMENARRFVDMVDSAAVYVNASTRFTDGAEFGLGAEVAISTQKLHARGPMALEALTTYKWIGVGQYTVRK